jgi:hypothetical protein
LKRSPKDIPPTFSTNALIGFSRTQSGQIESSSFRLF